MPISIIISYDGTAHDDDALMLGRMLSAAGASLSLAYVRHSREYDPRREEIGVHDADRRLEQGALWLEDESITRHVVVNPSTGAGLADLAASVAAQGLLDGGTVAIGVAAAGLRTRVKPTLETVSFLSDDPAGTASQTARVVASAAGAELVAGAHDADLIVVDSRASGPVGTVGLDGLTRGWLDSARGSVLVLPHGTTLAF